MSRLRTQRRALLVAVAVVLVALCATATASAAKPAVVALKVTPRTLPASGGLVTITGRVRNAVSCTVYDDVAPITVGCSSGRFRVRRRLPANTGSYPELYLPYAEAHNGRRNARSRDGQVEVLPASQFNVYTVLRQKRLLLTRAALDELRKGGSAASSAEAK